MYNACARRAGEPGTYADATIRSLHSQRGVDVTVVEHRVPEHALGETRGPGAERVHPAPPPPRPGGSRTSRSPRTKAPYAATAITTGTRGCVVEARHRHRRLGPRRHLVAHPPERVLPHATPPGSPHSRRRRRSTALRCASRKLSRSRSKRTTQSASSGPLRPDRALTRDLHVPRQVPRPGLVPLRRAAARRSSPNSRSVSRSRYRGSSRSTTCTIDLSTRLASRSATSVRSPSTVQTCSAAWRLNPPTNVASRTNSRCSSGVEQLVRPLEGVAQRAVAMVRAALRRTEHVHAPAQPVRRARSGPSVRSRAAASSNASGRPSSRRQISAIAAAFSAVSANAGFAADARSTSSCTASASAIACTDSASMSGSAERAHRPRALAGEPERLTTGGEHGDVRARRRAPGRRTARASRRRCSQLSSTMSISLVAQELDERRLEGQVLALLDFERGRDRLDRGALVARRRRARPRTSVLASVGRRRSRRAAGRAGSSPPLRRRPASTRRSRSSSAPIAARSSSRPTNRVASSAPALPVPIPGRRVVDVPRGVGQQERGIVGDDPVLELACRR